MTMDAAAAPTTTRTVRRRLGLDRPVAPDVVRDCVRTAQQAPNGGDREAGSWVGITDEVLREKTGAVYRAAFTARHRDADGGSRLVRSARHLAENTGRAPVRVLPRVRVPGGRPRAGSQASPWGPVPSADARQGVLIPTPFPLGDGSRPARCRPLDDVLHLNAWTETSP